MKILTHNVYWFQGSPSLWGEERIAEVPEVLNAFLHLYASAKVDILCLQEVHSSSLARDIAHTLEMPFWIHVSGGLRTEYGGVAMSGTYARFQDCTRYKGKVMHERVHLRVNIEKDGQQFEIASVHLPSNRFARSVEKGDIARIAELKRVVTEPNRPNIVVGDMNCPPYSPPYRFMQDSGYVDAATVAGYNSMIKHRVDYMWLDREFESRLSSFSILDKNGFRQLTDEGKTWQLSDHPPLLMDVR